jgi:hypothetical protein
MTDKDDQNQRNIQKRQAALQAVEDIVQGIGRNKLEGSRRLHAALLVSNLYRSARDKGHRREKIVAEISNKIRGYRSAEFRLEKWTLPQKIEVIDDAVLKRYHNTSEPQKDPLVYVILIKVLSRLAELEVDDLLDEFSRNCLPENAAGSQSTVSDEIEPSAKLADLLNACASTIARRADLANLWSRAARVQAGWNPAKGPLSKPLADGDTFSTFSPKRAATQNEWLADNLPPYPSVQIARIPFAFLSTELVIENHGHPEPYPNSDRADQTWQGDVFRRSATLTAYWDLWLAIAPTGSFGVGAFLVRTSSVDVALGLDGTAAETSHLNVDCQTLFTQDDIWAFAPEAEVVHIEFEDGLRRVSIPEDVFARLSDKDWEAAYRQLRSATDALDEDAPSGGIPSARIIAVTAGSVQNWLAEDLTWKRRDAFIETVDQVSNGDTSGLPATWNQGPTLAHALELALHRGDLDERFLDWIRSYNSTLAGVEHQWRTAAKSAERELRNRWVSAPDFDEEENNQ